MLEQLLFCFFTVVGAIASFSGGLLPPLGGLTGEQTSLIGGAAGGAIISLILIGLSRKIENQILQGEGEKLLHGSVASLLGALVGLFFYLILDLLFPDSSLLHLGQGGIILFLALLGFKVGHNQGESIFSFQYLKGSSPTRISPKLLDTSVIIDGRIGDLVKSGFIEGTIIIPEFILDELHNIADSSDSLRRRKGRRGLDILNQMRKSKKVKVETINKDYPDVQDVDRKLIQLAKELGAQLITTDYNLNKVVKVENLSVLNINELANAVKPKFIPGQELEVEVIEKGEEIGQGVGYLDDGTMVVVENGRRFIGKKIPAKVKSSLQTEAGKMLFVKPKGES